MPATPPRPPWSARLPRVVAAGEEGMISLVSLFAVMGLLILFGLFANVGKTVSRKLEAQNAADAVAHGAAVEMARGLNAVTTANHLIGELTALCVLHHGLGGDELDDGRKPRQTPEDIQNLIEPSYQVARIASSLGAFYPPWNEPHRGSYEEGRKQPQVGGAIWDSRVRLKQVLVWSYTAYAIGGFVAAIVEKIPIIGQALSAVTQFGVVAPSWVFQIKCYQEWLVLDGMERLAKGTAGMKKILLRGVIPGLQLYSDAVVLQTSFQMERAADQLGTRHGATGRLYPGGLKNPSLPHLGLPVSQDPVRPQAWEKTQLVRATTPWVQYWRVKGLRFGEQALLLSRFKCAFWDRTDEYTRTLTQRLREGGVRPYVLKGWEPDGGEKGREEWTRADGSRRADQLFSTVGFAHRPRPSVTSFGIFRQPNPDGMVAYAQGMAYGANPQHQSWAAGTQPQLGWDTLHWVNAVREFPGARPANDTYPLPAVNEPRVRVNWQAKLVPTTRLAESVWWQRGDMGRVIGRTPPVHLNLTGTH